MSRNANTEHSKELRRASAKKFINALTAANRFAVNHKDPAVIAAIRDGLAKIEGRNQAEKILFLIEAYQKKQE